MDTFRALHSAESQLSSNMQKREAREQPKAGKKKQRITQVRGSTKMDATGSSLLVKASEQMTKFFENFFGHCTEDAIQQFALSNLLNVMSRNPQPPSRLEGEKREPSSEKPSTEGRQSQNPETLKPGDWLVVASQRAIKHIKQATLDKSDLSLLIKKKIKQLSVGYFPAPNQTSLLSQHFGVPIYTADVNEELRLIYHIDFGAPTSSGQESQFIRIFSMLPKSEIDVTFWKSLAARLTQRGSEYTKRCCDRAETRIRFKRVETTPPKVYPPSDTSQWQSTMWQDGADVETNDELSLELHRILALEKFIPLSQTFFEAIQKHDETSFVFAVSSTENQIINHHSSCIVLDQSGTGKITCMLLRMLALDTDAKKCGRPIRQMFITQSFKLANRVRSQFLQLKQAQANSSTWTPAGRGGLSLQELEEKTNEGAIPAKFSQLDDSYFPLFLSYDQLCKLLEADCNLHFNPSKAPDTERTRVEGSSESKRGPLISLDYFQAKVWPRFDGRLKKGLHSTLVYNEFMSVIKGSEVILKRRKPYLDRYSYETQSNRAGCRDHAERSRIYTLFEAYLRLRAPSSYDIPDRIHLLLTTLEEKGVPGKYLDFIYVDEVQDHLILDAALLKYLCPNPHGLFLSGNPARMIQAGSTFRFSELKSALYHLEMEDVNVKRGTRKPVDPDFFQLSTNYRSHSGIVNAAAFIVSLIHSYYPHSIDSLAPEAFVVDVSGHKPTFFSGRGNFSDLLRFISYDRGGLGAQQVIIVRDEEASQRLQESIGTAAIVLTLYESKGMEFDDVLLYNFFSDSPATAADWRGLLRAQQENKTFDERRHSILQSELKSLYVGLTRARERVWVWDSSEKGRDMEALLAAAPVATSPTMSYIVPQVGVSSTSEEWRDRGQQFFVDELFSEAALCFTKAKLNWWTKVARTYHDRQLAMCLAESRVEPVSAFAEIARSFEALAGCVEDAQDGKDSRVLFANAAKCFATIPDHKAAADAFFKAEKYTEAAFHYHMAALPDKAIEIEKLLGT